MVLVRTRNPLNLGAAARAMSNFGVHHLRVVKPYGPSFREARSAVGASELLARAEEFPTVARAVADCTLVVGTTAAANRELQHPLRPLNQAATLIRRKLARGPVALLFGSEKTGLSNADLSHCHWLLRIPTRPQHGSMNLGQAVAVCLYELVRDSGLKRAAAEMRGVPQLRLGSERTLGRSAGRDLGRAATAAELERITEALMQSLEASGYTTPITAAATEEKVRRLLRRLDIQPADAELLLGMLRQILWKLGPGRR